MPIDKLILLTDHVENQIYKLVKSNGYPKGKYRRFLDLEKTDLELPVLLYCGGVFTGVNKIEFKGVSKLGSRRAFQCVDLICGGQDDVIIHRIDAAIDLVNVDVWQVAQSCRVKNAQSSKFYRSRHGMSSYPRVSYEHTVLIYEWVKRHLSKGDLLANSHFIKNEDVTRMEVQLCGRGIPIPEFMSIHDYGSYDFLENVSFVKLVPIRKNLRPRDRLAAERLQTIVQELGVQNAAKKFSPAQWAYLRNKFFNTHSENVLPDVKSLMQKSVCDWLENRIRFPRFSRP